MSSSYIAPEKLYFYTDPSNNTWCVSNTMLVFIYTMVSFSTVCFFIMGRQIIYSKRNRSVYMDACEAPDDSDAEDDRVQKELLEAQ